MMPGNYGCSGSPCHTPPTGINSSVDSGSGNGSGNCSGAGNSNPDDEESKGNAEEDTDIEPAYSELIETTPQAVTNKQARKKINFETTMWLVKTAFCI